MIEYLLKTLSAQHPTYGFQKLFQLIRGKNYGFNHKRVCRIYCNLKLNLKIKPKKRLLPRTAIQLAQPLTINQRWSLDFINDALITVGLICAANVIDDCNHGALGILVPFSLPSNRITQWLDQKIALSRGYPKRIQVDNGPENLSKHFQASKHGQKHTTSVFNTFNLENQQTQNAYIERC